MLGAVKAHKATAVRTKPEIAKTVFDHGIDPWLRKSSRVHGLRRKQLTHTTAEIEHRQPASVAM